MKKTLCILLAVVTCLSVLFLTACGGGNGGETEKAGQTGSAAPDSEATESETEVEPAPAVDLNEAANRFADEAPCGTHNWVHIQFGAASTLTEETLGAAIIEWLGLPTGYEVEFDSDSFDALHENYQAEGDGCSAGGSVRFAVKNSNTGETSETVDPFFYVQKNLEREDYEFTVCPDEAD